MDTSIAEFVELTGAAVRFAILYPFSKRPLKYYLGYGESKTSRRNSIYNWIVGIATLVVFLLIMKFLVYPIISKKA